ncbi:hypothetical protein [Ferrovibrio terrae]|uniref:hypothetical protein n=1 Tax=Ferrovibrio terrae TaxID=2594003 RepID=UPI00313776CF
MQPSPASEPRPPASERLMQLVAGALAIGLGGILLLCAVLVIEFGSSTLVDHKGSEIFLYHVLRGAGYLVLFGLAAWAVHQFVAPQRRRKYWIVLGVIAALTISPIGLIAFFSILFAFLRSIVS